MTIEHLLPYPSLYRAFQDRARQFVGQVAVRDGLDDTRYEDLERDSGRVGQALLALGIAKGDRIGLWAVNHAQWIIAALGIQAAGGVLIPTGTRLKPREVAVNLRRAEARVLFCDRGFGSLDFVAGLLAEDIPTLERIVVLGDGPCEGRVLGWSGFLALGDGVVASLLDERIAEIGPDDLADIIFTSGTTGQPKGVPMTQRQSLVACEQQQLAITHFSTADRFAITFPFAHNAGYRAGWQISLLFGVRIYPVRSYDPLDFLKLIDAEKISVMPAAPTIFQDILDHPDFADYDLSSLRMASTGGTMIPVRLIERMQAVFGARSTFTGYGLTETAGSVTSTHAGDAPAVIATTTGQPIPGLQVKLIDRAGEPVAAGQPGEICVRGPQVMKGYYRDPVSDVGLFTDDGFLRTGDVGVFDVEGNLRITDRLKDMYIVGGFNTYPAEIEQQLCLMDGVADAAVIGVEDDRLGQVGHAFVVRRAGAAIGAEEIVAWCRNVMANYKVPRKVTFLDTLPRNATGKVAKPLLRGLE